jgi:hypothetical protein
MLEGLAPAFRIRLPGENTSVSLITPSPDISDCLALARNVWAMTLFSATYWLPTATIFFAKLLLMSVLLKA